MKGPSAVSHTLTAAEKGYSQLEKEGLAVVFAVKLYHQYPFGRPFSIFIDHKPLMGLFSESKAIPPLAPARIQRWALTLSAYQYRIKYRKAGSENANADAFSSLPLPDTPSLTGLPPETVFLLDRLSKDPVTAKQIKMWTERDPVLSQVKRWVMQGWQVKACSQCQSNQKMPAPAPLMVQATLGFCWFLCFFKKKSLYLLLK